MNEPETQRRPLPVLPSRVLATGSTAVALAVIVEAVRSPVVVSALVFGSVVLGYGLVGWSRRAAVGGTVVLLAGALFAGATGLAPTRLLIAVGCLFFAYDLAEHAIELYHHVGTRAPTQRVELLHAAASGAVLAATGVVGVSLFRGLSGTGSTLTVVALLAGAVLLTGFLRA